MYVVGLVAIIIFLSFLVAFFAWRSCAERRGRLAEERGRLAAERSDAFLRVKLACADCMNAASSSGAAAFREERGAMSTSSSSVVAQWLDALPDATARVQDVWRALVSARESVLTEPGAAETDGVRADVEALCESAVSLRDERRPATLHESALRLLVVARSLWWQVAPSVEKRIYHEASMFQGHLRPDFVVTRGREKMPTALGALFVLEIKTAIKKGSARQQIEKYLCCRLRALVEQLESAGAPASAMAGLGSSGAMSCVSEVAFCRVHVAPGSAAERCPWIPRISISDWLPLLPPIELSPTLVPAGFQLLCRVLAAPLSAFEGATVVPRTANFNGATLDVLAHLGTGGFSDALEVTARDGMSAVLKRPRHRDAVRVADVAREARIIDALPLSQHLPYLVESIEANSSDALLMRPVGAALESLLPPPPPPHASAALVDAAAAARLQLARATTADVLSALAVAHAAGIVHGDVRLRNVIRVRETAVLVDWGSATMCSEVVQPQRWKRLCAQDILSAMKLYDSVCAAPSQTSSASVSDTSSDARDENSDAVRADTEAQRRRAELECDCIPAGAYEPWWLLRPGRASHPTYPAPAAARGDAAVGGIAAPVGTERSEAGARRRRSASGGGTRDARDL